MTHNTVFDKKFELDDTDFEFDYQRDLTNKLDADTTDFSQERLNEIVLWKVNRYARFDSDLIQQINDIDPKSEKIEVEKTRKILRGLLKTKGVQLAMASTILRFKNPNVYQIIDQRVFRIIYPNEELNLSSYLTEKTINNQIELYLKYLEDLREVCKKLQIDFQTSDRVLFKADRRINKGFKLKNY